MAKRSSLRVSKRNANNNNNNNSVPDSLSTTSVNPSSNRSTSLAEVTPNQSTDRNDLFGATDGGVQQRVSEAADSSSSESESESDVPDIDDHSVQATRRKKPTRDRQKGRTKPSKKKKPSKNSTSRLSDPSSAHAIHSDTDSVEGTTHTQSKEPASVWQYAMRAADNTHAICRLCNKKITTANWSTTSMRRHLVQVHGRDDLVLVPESRRKNNPKIAAGLKDKLHKLSIEAIIKDSLPFDSFTKSGLAKLLEEAVPGRNSVYCFGFSHA